MEEIYYTSDMAIRKGKRDRLLRAVAILILIIMAVVGSGYAETSAVQSSEATSASTTMLQMHVTQ